MRHPVGAAARDHEGVAPGRDARQIALLEPECGGVGGVDLHDRRRLALVQPRRPRSEEHTSELQSLAYLVCRLLLSEKNKSELQSLAYLVCRLLLEKQKHTAAHPGHNQHRTDRQPREPCALAFSTTQDKSILHQIY